MSSHCESWEYDSRPTRCFRYKTSQLQRQSVESLWWSPLWLQAMIDPSINLLLGSSPTGTTIGRALINLACDWLLLLCMDLHMTLVSKVQTIRLYRPSLIPWSPVSFFFFFLFFWPFIRGGTGGEWPNPSMVVALSDMFHHVGLDACDRLYFDPLVLSVLSFFKGRIS